MIATLMPNGKVVFTDKIENYTQLVLPNGHYAYSSEYDPITNGVVPLSYKVRSDSFLQEPTPVLRSP